ncbi:MAG: hypothetical protein ACTHJT_13515 [Cytophaga sp.]|uniref:hypothetical protein n=1 Tax=Cytophaga sp. TaxID=29535 RepID=UPI003F8017F9
MMKKIYSFIFLMLTGYVLCAYPISPRPLRKLVAESQYIVYADVVDVNAVSDTDIWSDHKASLVIREIYQGEFIQDTIEVHFRPTMICPAPARYKTGTSVLAFLYKVDSLNFYETQALSYGAKEMTTHEELMAYEARIREMQQINTIKDSIDRNTKTKDWLVTCAIDPYTRWEGVYELSPQSDFMSNYDYNKDKSV